MPDEESDAAQPRAGRRHLLAANWPVLLGLAVVALAYFDLRGQLEQVRLRLTVLETRAETAGVALAPSTEPPAPPLTGPPGASSARPSPAQPEGDCPGSLSTQQIQSALLERGPEVFACAARRRQTNPQLTGTVEMVVRVDPAGQVEDIVYRSPIRDPFLEPCIRETVAEWTFPPPTGGCADIRLPFFFAPPDQGPP